MPIILYLEKMGSVESSEAYMTLTVAIKTSPSSRSDVYTAAITMYRFATRCLQRYVQKISQLKLLNNKINSYAVLCFTLIHIIVKPLKN